MKNQIYFFFIEIQLVYNILLISAVQQGDSVVHAYIYIYILCIFFPPWFITGYQMWFNIQYIIEYIHYTAKPCCLPTLYIQFASANCKRLFHPFHRPSPKIYLSNSGQTAKTENKEKNLHTQQERIKVLCSFELSHFRQEVLMTHISFTFLSPQYQKILLDLTGIHYLAKHFTQVQERLECLKVQ